jgi:hypothetical protein
VLPRRGRHALDETGTWVRSDIEAGRHALPSEPAQPAGPRPAYGAELPRPVTLTRLAPPELPAVPPEPRFEAREAEPVHPSLSFPAAPRNAGHTNTGHGNAVPENTGPANSGYQASEPPFAAPAPPSYGPAPFAPPASPAYGQPEPAGTHAYPDYPPPDYPATYEPYYHASRDEPPPAAFTRQSEPFPEPDPIQLAITVRQVEGARRHLQAALLTLREALGAGGDVSMLAQVERTLSVATTTVSTLRNALDPETAERVLPGEARFCCSLPWLNTVLASAEISTAPATVPGATRILAALGYDAAVGATVDGQPQANVAGPGYRARIVLQQLRLAGSGEWLAYLDWHDANGQPHSEVETLGPAELTQDEVARRVDDALRRRLL